MQADAYGSNNVLYQDGRIIEAACMAYVRWKSHDVHVRIPTDIITEALKCIGWYTIGEEICGSPLDERLGARKVQTVPLIQSLYDWIQAQLTVLSRHPLR